MAFACVLPELSSKKPRLPPNVPRRKVLAPHRVNTSTQACASLAHIQPSLSQPKNPLSSAIHHAHHALTRHYGPRKWMTPSCANLATLAKNSSRFTRPWCDMPFDAPRQGLSNHPYIHALCMQGRKVVRGQRASLGAWPLTASGALPALCNPNALLPHPTRNAASHRIAWPNASPRTSPRLPTPPRTSFHLAAPIPAG